MSASSFLEFLAGFLNRPTFAVRELQALRKLAPPDPEQTAELALLVSSGNYDKIAKLLLKVAALDDPLLHRLVLEAFANIFLKIFASSQQEGSFLSEESAGRLLRMILRNTEPVSQTLSGVQRRQLATCIVALFWLQHGPEKTWQLHERAVLTGLKAGKTALLESLFQPALKAQHLRLFSQLEQALGQRDEYRENLKRAAARLAECELALVAAARANLDKDRQIASLEQTNAALEQKARAECLEGGKRLARQQGEVGASLAVVIDLLENGLAAMRAGRAEAARDHVERSLENLRLLARVAAAQRNPD